MAAHACTAAPAHRDVHVRGCVAVRGRYQAEMNNNVKRFAFQMKRAVVSAAHAAHASHASHAALAAHAAGATRPLPPPWHPRTTLPSPNACVCLCVSTVCACVCVCVCGCAGHGRSQGGTEARIQHAQRAAHRAADAHQLLSAVHARVRRAAVPRAVLHGRAQQGAHLRREAV